MGRKKKIRRTSKKNKKQEEAINKKIITKSTFKPNDEKIVI